MNPSVKIYKHPYSEERVHLIYKKLVDLAQNHEPIYYEIFVDGQKVVYKTNDPDEFDSFHDYIIDSTKEITIKLYSSTFDSPRNTKHIYQRSTSLDGVHPHDMNSLISEKIRIERDRWEAGKTKEDLNKAIEHIKELKKDIENLNLEIKDKQEEITTLQDGLLRINDETSGSSLTKYAPFFSVALEGIIKRNPKLLNTIPGLEGLTGMTGSSSNDSAIEETHSEVSFKEQSEPDFIEQLKLEFSDHEIELILKIIDTFSEDHQSLITVCSLLEIDNS